MSEPYFAIVIGAGPAGSTAARLLASAGHGPVRLLERQRFPRLKPCGSGLSANALRMLEKLGLLAAVTAEAYPINAAIIGAPSGRELLLEGDASSLVLRREQLDRLLVDAAVQAGAIFDDGVRVTGLHRGADGLLEVSTAEGRSWRCRWVVVATGALGQLTGQRLPPSRLVTMTGWYQGLAFRPRTMELYFDRELSPQYGWLFPEAPDWVNLGICLDAQRCNGRSARELFQDFLDRHFSQRLAGAQRVGPWRGFPIAASAMPAPGHTPPGVLVAGEAAHLANRATGEGISMALESGLMAAEAIEDGARKALAPAAVSERYQRDLRWRLGPRLWLSHRAADLAPTALDLITLAGRNATLRWLLAKGLARI